MLLRKWNFYTHEYEPYPVPDTATLVLVSQDMNLPVSCAGCLKTIIYGDSYTSRTIHTPHGFGYPVCESCYQTENDEDEAANRGAIEHEPTRR